MDVTSYSQVNFTENFVNKMYPGRQYLNVLFFQNIAKYLSCTKFTEKHNLHHKTTRRHCRR
ncbi:Hypothetical protein CINCED_3A024644 [Cinara cedri]|nr:Hypothetical protein CINCED_3A024644 [Cinara cedri]